MCPAGLLRSHSLELASFFPGAFLGVWRDGRAQLLGTCQLRPCVERNMKRAVSESCCFSPQKTDAEHGCLHSSLRNTSSHLIEVLCERCIEMRVSDGSAIQQLGTSVPPLYCTCFDWELRMTKPKGTGLSLPLLTLTGAGA